MGARAPAAAAAIAALAACTLWIGLSAGVILFNRVILNELALPFPLTLTSVHMAVCGSLAAVLVRGGWVAPAAGMDAPTYAATLAPVGALFAAVLYLGNAAYLHLSVAFIQMLKALMPAAVYGVACAARLDAISVRVAADMAAIVAGVALAAAGELTFVPLGVTLQLASVAAESVRLVLLQKALQGTGLRLNPVTTMYYVAPAALVCLSIPWLVLEAGPLRAALAAGTVRVTPAVLAANALAAAALNLAAFALIGRTSALTMNVAGVVKDWGLIWASASLFGAPVTRLNLAGYGVALAGVASYNVRKYNALQEAAAAAEAGDKERGGGELKALRAPPLSDDGGDRIKAGGP